MRPTSCNHLRVLAALIAIALFFGSIQGADGQVAQLAVQDTSPATLGMANPRVDLVAWCAGDCDGTNCCAADGCDQCDGCAHCQSSECALLDSMTHLVIRSEPCFDGLISPITNPLYFEDPRTLTEARMIYLHNKVPLTAAGGSVDLFTMQLRAALSQRLSVIMTKNGFLTSDSPLVGDGWADINLGLKYNLIRCPDCQWIYSVGATYEAPFGSTRSLQGNGDGTVHLFSTTAKRFGEWNALLAHGWLLPVDAQAETEWGYFSSHLSHRIGNSNFYGLAEINWYTRLDDGAGPISGIEGLDLFNFGALNVDNSDILTGAFGVKYVPSRRVEIGVAWENPLTRRRDILENRLNINCILRY